MKLKTIYILLVALLMAEITEAQNSTSSPSSRFAYGEMNDNIPNAYRAMGGANLGQRRNTVIDPSQPASYTACDSTSFMFDLAGSIMWTNYSDGSGKRNKANGNLEYVTLQFPIWKQHIAFSAGIMPYTVMGYSFGVKDSVGGHEYGISYIGEGGITQLYGGLSFNIMDWVALGANFYYMFGEINNETVLSFTESDIHGSDMWKNMRVGSFRFRYGLQFFHTFDKHSFCLGGIFENKQRLNGEYAQYEINSLDSVLVSNTGFEVPMTYGGGLSYNYANRLIVACDYYRQDWNDVLYFGEKGTLKNRAKISFGCEYRHNPNGRNYAERMFWRVGASIIDSYVANSGQKDFSISAGFGLPLRTSATMVNTTLEYIHRASINKLNENCLKLTIAVSVNENWFFKRKL